MKVVVVSPDPARLDHVKPWEAAGHTVHWVAGGGTSAETIAAAVAAERPDLIYFDESTKQAFDLLVDRAGTGTSSILVVIGAAGGAGSWAVPERQWALRMADAVVVSSIQQSEELSAGVALEPHRILAAPKGGIPPSWPAVRHPQSQAGLATMAANETSVAVGRSSKVARLLRVVPGPVARLAVKVVPQRLKDRFRDVASWPAEEARRHRAHRHARTRRLGGSRQPAADVVVSVVVPCFEQGEFLLDAVSSVYEQSFDGWEIVVVDDGSTEVATIAAIDEVAEFRRVRLVRQSNGGLAAARNAGIKAAAGAFVVPLDADDELAPDFLTKLLAMAEPDVAFVHCWAELFGDTEEIWATRPFNLYQMMLSNSVVGCVLLRKAAWQAVGGYDETMRRGNEDWELWLRLALAGWKEAQVREPLFRYRKHGTSMSTRTEARFEEGRQAIAQRHPDAYAPPALAAMKRGWYPAVSMIGGGGGHDMSDCEVLAIGPPSPDLEERCRDKGWPLRQVGSVAEAVTAAKGKYVTDATAVRWAHEAALGDAVAALEAQPLASAVGAGTDAFLWRRWVLVDAVTDHGGMIEASALAEVVGPSELRRGAFRDEQWQLPELDVDLPIHRQGAEVEGVLPGSL